MLHLKLPCISSSSAPARLVSCLQGGTDATQIFEGRGFVAMSNNAVDDNCLLLFLLLRQGFFGGFTIFFNHDGDRFGYGASFNACVLCCVLVFSKVFM
jgi:hypothetical protein